MQENNLTLATAIAKCHSKVAAKKLNSDIVKPGSEMFAAIDQPYQLGHHMVVACAGCGSAMHVGTRHQECLIKHMS